MKMQNAKTIKKRLYLNSINKTLTTKMPVTEMQAPSLSTYQDESAFSYAKVSKAELHRAHLNLQPGEDYIEKITEYYSLEELLQFLKQTVGEGSDAVPKFRRVTLQFPDSLISDSASIVQVLQKKLNISVSTSTSCSNEASDSCCGGSSCSGGSKLGEPDSQEPSQRLWILADTSYSSCCVDEVAAEHVNSDLVVHFGDACLNPLANLTSAYVFGKPHLDIDTMVSKFHDRYPANEYNDKTIVLMADAPHTHTLHELKRRLPQYNVIVADLVLSGANVFSIDYKPTPHMGELVTLNRAFEGVKLDGEDEEASSVLSEYELFHITVPETPRLLQLTTMFLSVTTYDPALQDVSQGPFPNLMRRYRFMHMARAAGTVGILVNTLSLANTKTLMNKVGAKIKREGKKHYLFVVGKPNVAKLANFDAVDVWCVLGCDNQGIIIDQYNEYYKPIVTPYELLLAIGDELNWTGKWVTDFNKVLHTMGEEEDEAETEDNNSEDEAPEFNPVTGQYVSLSRPLRRLRHLQISQEEEASETENSGALVKKLSGAIALRDTVSTSAAHLLTREWTGLGSDWVEGGDEGAEVEEGTGGIARGYDFDVANRVDHA